MAEGVLLIDKPTGLTSHDVVARVRKRLAQRRVGHTGTLDPFATGLMVLCVGRVTRLARGMPVGGSIEFLDEATLGRALEGRQEV